MIEVAPRAEITALLFAGQGVDPPWVAPDVMARPAAQALLAAASELTGADIARLLARGVADLTVEDPPLEDVMRDLFAGDDKGNAA